MRAARSHPHGARTRDKEFPLGYSCLCVEFSAGLFNDIPTAKKLPQAFEKSKYA
jgi:hypothetical protein